MSPRRGFSLGGGGGGLSPSDAAKLAELRVLVRTPGGYPYVVVADDGVILVDNVSAARTINLQTLAAFVGTLEIQCLGNADLFPVTLAASGGDTINGASTLVVRGNTPRIFLNKTNAPSYWAHITVAPTRDLFFVGALSSTAYYGTSAVSWLPGANQMTILATYRSLVADSPPAQFLWTRLQVGVEGFRFGPTTSSGGNQRASATVVTGVSATGTVIAAANYDTAKWYTMALRVDVGGTNTATVFLNGVATPTTAAIASYVPATNSASTVARIGAANSGVGQCEVAAIAIIEGTAMSDANILAYHQQVSSSNNFGLNGTETALWTAQDAGEATWLDRKSGLSLPRVGTPVRGVVTNPVFA